MAKPLAGPQTLLRTLNARAILEALARRGPLTRAELMGETGLSRTAVTQVLRMLESGDAVASAGVDRKTNGPAATRVSLHPRLGFAAAVHADHHFAHVAILDATGTVRAEQHAELRPLEDRAERIAALVAECRRGLRGPLVLAVVAVPGIVTAEGDIRDDQGPDGGSFRNALVERLGCPVRVENDVNLAALAEAGAGAGAELSSFALLLLDDGLGAGLIIDGTLHRGASGMAGEVQYLPQSPLPLAAPVLGDTVVADLALTHDRDPAHPLPVHLEACLAGDDSARRMVDEMARRLVVIAGSMTLVVDPAAFVLAGHAAHPAFADAVRRSADELGALLPMRFLVSSFGAEATLIGASSEATNALRTTVFTRILSRSDRIQR